MFQLNIPETELFDEAKNKRVHFKGATLQLEHSLVSLSKWESKWKVPFLGNNKLTTEMSIDYIRFMTMTQNVDPTVYNYISQQNIDDVRKYIEDPMTATTFRSEGKKGNRSVITAEIIYYWMVALQIPFDPCQKWHLNRLLTLIRVCDEKNSPKKKMSKREAMNRQRSLNAARRAKYHTSG